MFNFSVSFQRHLATFYDLRARYPYFHVQDERAEGENTQGQLGTEPI